ncbi:MAG TPA: GNAT family N-acetyltransferase [Solirubrobacteraceae bacterium]|nr:GNAT family N-acetyltransferase [Solirubrobacteraceae bacterium]
MRTASAPAVAAGPAASDWDALADRTGADPFVRPEWVAAWHAAFGGGELVALTAHHDGGLTGVLPMVARVGIWRSPTNDHTPAFAPLADDGRALHRLAHELLARRPAAVSLAYLDAASPAVDELRGVAHGAGWATRVRAIHRSPVLELGDAEAWEADRPRRAIADLRRRRRRLGERGRLTFAVAREAVALGDVLVLERRSWKGTDRTAVAEDPRLRRFYEAVASWAAARGILRIPRLRLDARPVAALLALQDGETLHLLKGGYDPAFAEASPGQLLLQDVLRQAFTDGLRRVELHGDAEPYKQVWTSDVRRRIALEMFAPTRAGRLARAAADHARPVARRALLLRQRPPRRTPR